MPGDQQIVDVAVGRDEKLRLVVFSRLGGRAKLLLAAGLAVLFLLLAWLMSGERVAIQGVFTKHDIAELKELAHSENWKTIKMDCSQSRHDIRQAIRVLRRYLSERVVRIVRTPDDKTIVTIERGVTGGRDVAYLCVKTKTGWKLAPPEFE